MLSIPKKLSGMLTPEKHQRLLSLNQIANQELLSLQKEFSALADYTLSIHYSSAYVASCHFDRQEIMLPGFLMMNGFITEAELIKAVRHECAHAIVAPDKTHGSAFKQVAKQIGAETAASVELEIPSKEAFVRAGGANWVIVLPDGEVVDYYHRKPRRNFTMEFVRDKRTGRLSTLKLLSIESYLDKYPG